MTYYHPIWQAPGPADLKAGSAFMEKAKLVGAKTQRERDYIAAIETFYKDSDKIDHGTRALAYERAMEQVQARYPDDHEAAIFHALALLATAPPTDKTYVNQKRAGAILEPLFAEEPEHPGIAHYIIHAYDYPPLAQRALDAARRYAKIAPDSPHALHMPSHIFTRLGLWQESIDSNLASVASAKKNNAPENELHAKDYLIYAYLQGAQDREAKEALEAPPQGRRDDPQHFELGSTLWARLLLDMRLSDISGRKRLRWRYHQIRFRAGAGHGRRRICISHAPLVCHIPEKPKLPERRYRSLHRFVTRLPKSTISIGRIRWKSSARAQRLGLGWLRARGRKLSGRCVLPLSTKTLTDKHPVTPGVILPARELLGEMLLELNKPAEAMVEFEATLRTLPNRFNSLSGAARAAKLCRR